MNNQNRIDYLMEDRIDYLTEKQLHIGLTYRERQELHRLLNMMMEG